MRRAIAASVAAIVLLFASSVSIIAWVTGDGAVALDVAAGERSRPAPPIAPGDTDPHDVVAAAAPAAPSDERGVVDIPPPLTAARPAAPSLEQRPRGESVHIVPAEMPAPRRKALRDFRLEMKAGINALLELVSPCPVVDASFSISLESVADGVRVVNATPESSAESDTAGVACVQAALRGQLIITSSIEPGKRWQMSVVVNRSI